MKISFETSGASFEDNQAEETATILRAIAAKILNGAEGGVILDANGNRIGEWGMKNDRHLITPTREGADEERFYVQMLGHEPIGDDLSYADAVALLNATCDEWEAEGWTVDRSWASSGNYSAAHAVQTDTGVERFIAVEREVQD